MDRRTVDHLGIDDVANTYLSPHADVVKHVRRTRNIGVTLGESVGKHEVGNASVGRETSERFLVSVES